MINTITIKRSRIELENRHTQKFGGYITYWVLFFRLLKMTFGENSFLSKWQKTYSAFEFLIKSPWWLIIKPLRSLFSVKKFYKGFYELDNGGLERHNISRTTTIKFLFLPIFFYWRGKIKRKEVFELMGESDRSTAVEIDSSHAQFIRNL